MNSQQTLPKADRRDPCLAFVAGGVVGLDPYEGLGRPPQTDELLAHAPGTKHRLQHQPESLIGDDKRVVGGRVRMQQAIADRNVGPLGLNK